MRIVLAEDEFLIADMLTLTLEDAGHEVYATPNGMAALRLVEQHRPDLIITDFMMPIMTGLELAEAVKAQDDLRHIPIMLVSGAQGAIARQRADLFDVVLDKPYRLADLLSSADRLVSANKDGG